MKRIYILGVNGNARDVLEAIRLIRANHPDFPEAGGFLDDRVPKGTLVDGIPVCGAIRSAAKLRDACFVNAIGSPESYLLKPSIIARTGAKDSAFISVVHPQAAISSTATLGRGSVVLSQTSIGCGVKIGNHVMILQNCVISHDSRIEDYAVLATGVCLSGNARVGKNAYLGSSSSIRGNQKVGARSLIGLGSAVVKNVPSDEIWCGNPARRLKAANPTLCSPTKERL